MKSRTNTLGWMVKKKSSNGPTAVLNRYLKNVTLARWTADGHEFKELSRRSKVPASAISKCSTQGEGLGLDPIAKLVAAIGLDFPTFWKDAHTWAHKHPPADEPAWEPPTTIPGWADAAAKLLEREPAWRPFVELNEGQPLPPAMRSAHASVASVRLLARIWRDAAIRDEEKQAHVSRLRRDSSVMPKGGKPR